MYLRQTNSAETYGVCPVIPEDIAPPHQICSKIKAVSNIADAEQQKPSVCSLAPVISFDDLSQSQS